jgi:hypothetical protein
MDVLQIPAVAMFTGILISFAVVMLFVTVGDFVRRRPSTTSFFWA